MVSMIIHLPIIFKEYHKYLRRFRYTGGLAVYKATVYMLGSVKLQRRKRNYDILYSLVHHIGTTRHALFK